MYLESISLQFSITISLNGNKSSRGSSISKLYEKCINLDDRLIVRFDEFNPYTNITGFFETSKLRFSFMSLCFAINILKIISKQGDEEYLEQDLKFVLDK